ncbi:hypothetical protein HPG69_007579 [Diceros bicornis minor]|uniref:MROH2B-like HEAT-repeats domain-containing protein n=1 Tax=Diceros bicornis minor TaxID=77932 RepID=A0A7J7F7K2_DICBM|nr:hypothetical protein HPG69_007579 [Diceros bicornis minor]
MAVKSVPFLNMDVWSKDLLCALTKPNWTQQEQPPEKAFLFSYYGRILQAEENSTTVRKHLLTLLETSHQWPKQREPGHTLSPDPGHTLNPDPGHTLSPDPGRTLSPDPGHTLSPDPGHTLSPDLGYTLSPDPSHTLSPDPSQLGMALTVGLAAVCHLDHVWAVLEQFGRSKPIKWSLHSLSPKNSEDFRWKWASSTILLAYGQMAAKAKAHILPWVDNILSRMVYYFQHSPLDETLKQSFLTAVLMLVEAISRDEGAHSYTFSQISELLESLMVLLEKEPRDTLCTPNRQQTIHIISSLW